MNTNANHERHFKLAQKRLMTILKDINTDYIYKIQITIKTDTLDTFTWYISNANGKFEVEPYNYYDNNVHIVTNWSKFNNFLTAHTSAEKYYYSIAGNNCNSNQVLADFLRLIELNGRTKLRYINN